MSGCFPGFGDAWPKAAAISTGLTIGRVHGPVPESAHGPSQPAKRPSGAASGVNVTVVPCGTTVPHELSRPPQLKFEPTIRPGPPTESMSGVGFPTNDAVACCFRSSATSQMAAVPMQSPSHFTNSNPSRADAVSRRTLPFRYEAVHRVPQSIRPSLLVICPPPTTPTLSTRPVVWCAAAPETVQSVNVAQMAASSVRGIATTKSLENAVRSVNSAGLAPSPGVDLVVGRVRAGGATSGQGGVAVALAA